MDQVKKDKEECLKGKEQPCSKALKQEGMVYLGNLKYILVLLENGLSFNGSGKQRCYISKQFENMEDLIKHTKKLKLSWKDFA